MKLSAVGALAVTLLFPSLAQGQNPAILSFYNGQITWTNSDPNLYYTVQWASSLTAPNWTSSYAALQDIQSFDSIVTARAPVYLRMAGTSNRLFHAAPVPKTGQISFYAAGDDGDTQAGVEWPSPRFTDLSDGTIIDNLTGLMWTKNANLSTNEVRWANALANCNNLVLAGHDDWRMPNVREMLSLIDFGEFVPALPSGHPFDDVESGYWTSTTDPFLGDAFYVSLSFGWTFTVDKVTDTNSVLAVRTP